MDHIEKSNKQGLFKPIFGHSFNTFGTQKKYIYLEEENYKFYYRKKYISEVIYWF